MVFRTSALLRLVVPSYEVSQRTECSDLSVVTLGCDKKFYCLALRHRVVFVARIRRLSPPP